MRLEDQFRARIDELSLFKPNETLIVAVSGGPDSVALLDLLRHLAPAYPLRLHVAHLDHMLRESGIDDATWVGQLCSDWEIPLTIEARQVRATAAKRGQSIEDAARQLRYAFLAAEAAKHGADAVVTGHQADDQAETILMNFLRGSGLDGLRGMRRVSDYPIEAKTYSELEDQALDPAKGLPRLVRPLLDVPRHRILEYLARKGIEAREDSSNQDLDFLRNRIRHALLPAAEEINPSLRETLLRNAKALGGDLDFLETQTEEWIERSVLKTPRGIWRVDRAQFAAAHPAIQRRVLRALIDDMEHGPSLRDIGWLHLEGVRKAVPFPGALPGPLPGGLELHFEENHFELRRARERKVIPSLVPPGELQILEPPCRLDWGAGWRIEAEVGPRRTSDLIGGRDPWRVLADADSLPGSLSVRGRQDGDKMQPLGMGGRHKRLQDLFVDDGIPRQLRAGWPLILAGQSILWVPGLRLDERAKITGSTRRVYRLSVKPPPGALR